MTRRLDRLLSETSDPYDWVLVLGGTNDLGTGIYQSRRAPTTPAGSPRQSKEERDHQNTRPRHPTVYVRAGRGKRALQAREG